MSNVVKISICVLIFIIISGFVSGYFLGSYIDLQNSVSLHNLTYNMTTGCPFDDDTCIDILTCYEPFYQHCPVGGMIGILIALFPISLVVALLIILSNEIDRRFPTVATDSDNATNATDSTDSTNQSDLSSVSTISATNSTSKSRSIRIESERFSNSDTSISISNQSMSDDALVCVISGDD